MDNFREEELTIDLRDVWHTLKKNMGTVRKVTFATTALAIAYVLIVPPTYESQAMLRIKPEKGISSSLLDDTPFGNTQTSQRMLNTYQEILKSKGVVEQTIKDTEKPNDKGEYPEPETYVLSRITTRPYKDTDMVMVAVKGKSPEQAQAANKALINNFMKRLAEIDQAKYTITREFLEARIVTAEKELYAAEDKLNNYRKNHKIISADDAVKMASEKMAMTDKLKAQNQIDMEAANAKASALSNAMQGNATSIADSEVIRSYNNQLAQLEAKRVEYATKYTVEHPKMVEVNHDIKELQKKLDEAIMQVARGQAASTNPTYNGLLAEKLRSEAEASVASSNLATIAAIEAKYGEDFDTLSDNQQEYLRLMRKVKVANEIYEMLSKRLEEAKVAEVSISRDVAIVDGADLPKRPIAPRKGRTVALGFLLGLLASSAFVVARGLMNRTIKTGEEAKKYLGLPVLGQIPSSDSLKEAQEEAELSFFQRAWRTLWKK